jgi:DNA-binding GntR family transcriptional regulator
MPPVNPVENMRPIVHQTMAAKVYQDLREMIMSGQLQPGERLTLAGMAAALGTSVMPVREAINKLAADAALEILPNKSVRVPVLTRSRFEELIVVRLVVEGLAVETAASRINEEQLGRLAELEQAFCREITHSQPDVDQIIQINKQFHFTAYAAAQMPVLSSLIEGLWLRIGPVLNLDFRNSRSRRRSDLPSVTAHHALLAALRAGDGAAARAALTLDIKGSAEVILSETGLKEG